MKSHSVAFPCDRPCLQRLSAVQRKTCCSRQRCFYSVLLQRLTLRYILYICSYGTVQIFSQNQPNLSFFFSAAFVRTSVLGIPLAKIFRFSVLLLLLIVKQTQQQTSAEGGSGLNVIRPAVLMIKSQFEGRYSDSAALLSFPQLAAHQLYLCSCSLFSPEKEI